MSTRAAKKTPSEKYLLSPLGKQQNSKTVTGDQNKVELARKDWQNVNLQPND